jgi:signal transduction histidine kinase
VRTARDGDRVLVEIGDNGAGIPAGAAAHILEHFFTTKPVGKGTGLGLDICWRIVVQRHGGDLRFASTPGDIRFQVLLPSSNTGISRVRRTKPSASGSRPVRARGRAAGAINAGGMGYDSGRLARRTRRLGLPAAGAWDRGMASSA